jgi:transcriptional regulator with XRE-family HTH domain
VEKGCAKMQTSRTKIPELIPFGRKLRQFRKEAGLSQEDLGLKLNYGSPNSMISQIEGATVRMQIDDLILAAKILGVPPGLLVSEQDYTDYEIKLIVAFFRAMIYTPKEESDIHIAVASLLGVQS